jgi:nitrite reductase/ring-hydroxylating ferredoxin subunit/uncharacterized membrane protein
MKSKAHIKSHPIHPILIVFPIAFFSGTLLFDVLSLVLDNHSMAATGGYLNIAGVFAAIITASPGFIDFLYTVPPKSSASKRAAKHGIINACVLLLFAFIWWYRQSDDLSWIIAALDAAGVTLMMIAGWMGGTLVHRNQIGVDIRYAAAGKWKEEYISPVDGVVQVANADELKTNQMKLVHVKGQRIVVAKTEDGYIAFDDHCTHRGGSLAGGAMICGTVQCPWHGSQFDVRTGAVKAGPAKESIRTYPVEESGGDVFIRL